MGCNTSGGTGELLRLGLRCFHLGNRLPLWLRGNRRVKWQREGTGEVQEVKGKGRQGGRRAWGGTESRKESNRERERGKKEDRAGVYPSIRRPKSV